MSSTTLLRIAARAPSTFFRSNGIRQMVPRTSSAAFVVPGMIVGNSFSSSSKAMSDDAHSHEESFEEFTAR
jgi:hypothetical protein